MKAIVLSGTRTTEPSGERDGEMGPTPMTPVAGIPALVRVLGALRSTEAIDGGLLAGPEQRHGQHDGIVAELLAAGDFEWTAPAAGPAESALKAVQQLDTWPIVLTTGDHALLTAPTIDDFCAAAAAQGADLTVGLAPHSLVAERFPGLNRTRLRFAGGAYCGTNLFYLHGPKAAHAIAFWASVQANRKRPWRIVRHLGWRTLATYACGRLSIDRALAALSRLMDCTLGWVEVKDPLAAIDVDSPADLAVAERTLQCQSRSS
ncbi:MAG: NTP transferase domain-containing protein [Gammaproteobacteria bacterium]|nr:NTP transferase domain-containing protein [Gammaproteobacteria bacterium]MYK83267.1 NTP transferase domain-containing protein [Gammaproteobacteria bacterium]